MKLHAYKGLKRDLIIVAVLVIALVILKTIG